MHQQIGAAIWPPLTEYEIPRNARPELSDTLNLKDVMTNEEFEQLLALSHEISGVEFKGRGRHSDRQFFAQVVRAVLAMANRRDGGIIVIGVEDTGTSLNPIGLSVQELTTWRYDDVADGIASYTDPGVSFELEVKEHLDNSYVVIEVSEFEDVPVLCKRSYQGILRDGACYVRTRRKPETTEIPSQAEMRDLLDLATDKALRRFVERVRRTGLAPFLPSPPDDEDLYNEQRGDLR